VTTPAKGGKTMKGVVLICAGVLSAARIAAAFDPG
jgi:hypothetical protein